MAPTQPILTNISPKIRKIDLPQAESTIFEPIALNLLLRLTTPTDSQKVGNGSIDREFKFVPVIKV
jgi:hypothetical protein